MVVVVVVVVMVVVRLCVLRGNQARRPRGGFPIRGPQPLDGVGNRLQQLGV
jgi:hypothetical protein